MDTGEVLLKAETEENEISASTQAEQDSKFPKHTGTSDITLLSESPSVNLRGASTEALKDAVTDTQKLNTADSNAMLESPEPCIKKLPRTYCISLKRKAEPSSPVRQSRAYRISLTSAPQPVSPVRQSKRKCCPVRNSDDTGTKLTFNAQTVMSEKSMKTSKSVRTVTETKLKNAKTVTGKNSANTESECSRVTEVTDPAGILYDAELMMSLQTLPEIEHLTTFLNQHEDIECIDDITIEDVDEKGYSASLSAFYCSDCRYTFPQEIYYKSHKRETKCMFPCPHCDDLYSFRNYSQYEKHMKTHRKRRVSQKLKRYDQKLVPSVIALIKETKMSVYKASKLFGIPQSTLHDKIHNRTSTYRCYIKPVSRSVLSNNEETRLAQWIVDMCDKKQPRSRSQIFDAVKCILDTDGRASRFVDNRPTSKWWKSFTKRHPEVAYNTIIPTRLTNRSLSPIDPNIVLRPTPSFNESKDTDDVYTRYSKPYTKSASTSSLVQQEPLEGLEDQVIVKTEPVDDMHGGADDYTACNDDTNNSFAELNFTGREAESVRKPTKRVKRFLYEKESLHTAVNEVKQNNMSLKHAANLYGIPRSTLYDKIHELTPLDTKPKTVLAPVEERRLVAWVESMAAVGLPRSRGQILDAVQRVLDKAYRPNPFKDNRPGQHWWQYFLARNPDIVPSMKLRQPAVTQGTDTIPSLNPDVILGTTATDIPYKLYKVKPK